MIPADPRYRPNHCHACASAYGRAFAGRLRAEGTAPACGGCGGAMDLLALQHSDERICTECRVKMVGSAARGGRRVA